MSARRFAWLPADLEVVKALVKDAVREVLLERATLAEAGEPPRGKEGDSWRGREKGPGSSDPTSTSSKEVGVSSSARLTAERMLEELRRKPKPLRSGKSFRPSSPKNEVQKGQQNRR